jgi:uncharacterized coiled-coil protein SlyX
MSLVRRARTLPLFLVLLAACDTGRQQQLENQLMLMQERLAELESQAADAEGHAERLNSAATDLQAYVGDLEAKVIDLSASVPRDLLVDVEATLGNVKNKALEVRERAALLDRTVDTDL